MSKKRIRRVGSIKKELLCKSREAALAAVQIFNNPNITFKAESFIVLMIIAWTYLLHAYYRSIKIEYRYFNKSKKRRRFDRTEQGAYKHWGLKDCLNNSNSPIDRGSANNLRFLIGIRNEIEHQMTKRIDDLLSARFQACCLNYNRYLKTLFTNSDGIDKHLSFSLQFSAITPEQKNVLSEYNDIPASILGYIDEFDNSIGEEEFNNPYYAYRIIFVPKLVNHIGQADKVIEFMDSASPLAKEVNSQYAVIREKEKRKYLPGQIVTLMKSEGYPSFNVTAHTKLWKKHDAEKDPNKGYGTKVADKHWHWYEKWVEVVRKHCQENRQLYM